MIPMIPVKQPSNTIHAFPDIDIKPKLLRVLQLCRAVPGINSCLGGDLVQQTQGGDSLAVCCLPGNENKV